MKQLSHSPLAQKLRETNQAVLHPNVGSGVTPAPFYVAGAGAEPEIVRAVELPKIPDQRGNLSFIEAQNHIPFDIKRVYYLYDVPGGAYRGGHAHKDLHQLIIAMAGSFDMIVDNGVTAEKFSLNRSYYGLHIPPMTWRELENFSSGAVCLVLASEHYDELDYYRDYNAFLADVQAGR